MSLNPEPADPQERREHHLPPKSYADVVEEDAPSGNFIDEDSIKETPPRLHTRQGSEPRPLGEVLDESDAASLHQNGDDASSLYSLPSTPVRIGRKPVPGRSFADAAAKGTDGNHPIIDMHDDAEQYTGAGMDESPRSPIRKPHKRNGSRSTPNGQKKTLSDGGQTKLVYEEVFSSKDGEHLTSVKPDDELEADNRIDKKKSPQEQKPVTKEDLVSGRRAGAGWESSASVYTMSV